MVAITQIQRLSAGDVVLRRERSACAQLLIPAFQPATGQCTCAGLVAGNGILQIFSLFHARRQFVQLLHGSVTARHL